MMNQVAIPAAVGRLLDRAEVRGKERDQYQDLAPSLWDAMGVNMPENEEGMLALVRDCAANAGCGSLDQGLLLSVAGIVARFRKHSLNLSEHGRFGHSCGGA
jgi:DNA-binding transcriptional regulator PaaX